MKNLIPYNRQFIDKSDYNYVIQALKNDLITTGKFVDKFEKRLSELFKSKYVAVCTNGTAALHLAFLSINLKKNDNIILPSINFVAAENMAKLMGAKIFFADVSNQTGQVTYQSLQNCVKKYQIKKVKAFVVNFLGGNIHNYYDYYKFKKKNKCYFIEDACHALGSIYKIGNKKFPVGNCKYSDISTFSFHPVKPITTGEGGAVSTNDKKIFQKILLYRNHGFDRSFQKNNKVKININKLLGFNYRLSDINCALGVSQLKKLNKFKKHRNLIFLRYKNNFKSLENYITLIDTEKGTTSSRHLIIALIDFKKLKINKENLRSQLLKNNIITQIHYFPFFLKDKKINLRNYNGSKKYFESCLSIPAFHKLKLKDVDKISNKIKKIIFQNLR